MVPANLPPEFWLGLGYMTGAALKTDEADFNRAMSMILPVMRVIAENIPETKETLSRYYKLE